MSGFPAAIVPVGHVEPVPRRVRARLDGAWVLDTTDALYVWEKPYYPQFYVPRADVRADLLVDEEQVEEVLGDRARRHGLRVGTRTRTGGARVHEGSSVPALAGTVRFDWDALDAWYEEDEEVFTHPRNPYTRVDAVRSRRRVRVSLDGRVVAESGASVMVFETGLPTRYYLDPTTVDLAALEPSDTVTACPYKGRTSGYWSIRTGKALHPDLAWCYHFPTRELLPIAGLIAFYDEKVDVEIDGVGQARPRSPFFA